MKRLGELLEVLPEHRLVGDAQVVVAALQFWLPDLKPGELFVAIRGNQSDGHGRIGEAIAAGARAILCDRLPGTPVPGISYIVVPDTIRAMGLLVHAWHEFPSRRLRVVGVTGTNGKTSTATLLHRLFRTLGKPAGLLSNIRDYVNDDWTEARYTTGHALFLAEMMARMAAANCAYCFMEVSSQSAVEQRLSGVDFAGGIFTNLSQDHLDYHGSMAAYGAAKKAWFDSLPSTAFALANADDPRGDWMTGGTKARRLSYGTADSAGYRFELERETLEGLSIRIGAERFDSPLLGSFNAYNLAAVFAAACELGEEPGEAAAALARVPPVEGRMQAIRSADGRLAVVDYAHTPDAVEQVLRHLRAMAGAGRQVITVIGCGGGGDVSRRPVMGRLAAALSDRLIVTTDNARWEDPAAIAATLVDGIAVEARGRTDTILDRQEAIDRACAAARPGDIVLIAGKGHERYQEIGGVRTPFDDVAVARAALAMPVEPVDDRAART